MSSSTFLLNGIALEIGDTIEINGITYELDILQDAGGSWAIWYDANNEKSPRIYATPNYCIGVPIDVVDYEGLIMDELFTDGYKPFVSSYREYKSIVKTLIKRYVRLYTMIDKDKVVEELNKLIEHYFEEKAQQLKLKSGDISPDLCFILDKSIEDISKVVISWARLNSESG